jgi:hypothetical protein
MEQEDFLKMSEEEWRGFVNALRELSEEELETFLRFHGLYAFIDAEELWDAVKSYTCARLWELISALVRSAGFDVVAALEWPCPMGAGRIEAFPREEEWKLLRILEHSPTHAELILNLMEAYGPCVIFYADDGNTTSTIVVAKPGVRG